MTLVSRVRRMAQLGFMKILAGNGLAQIIQLTSLLLIARIFTPAAVGLNALAIALSALVFPWAALRWESAVVLPREDSEAKRIATTAFVTLMTTSLLAGIGVELVRRQGLLNSAFSGLGSVAVSLLIAAGASVALFNQIAVRHERYDLVGSRPVIQQGTTAASQILGGLIAPHWLNLPGGQILGRAVALVSMGRLARFSFARPSLGMLRSTAAAWWKYPAVFTPSTILNTAVQQLPLLLSARLISTSALGGLSIAWQISLAPVALIAIAISENFAGTLARRRREGRTNATGLYLRVSGGMAVIAVAIAVAMVLAGPPLLLVLLGPEWEAAAEFIRILALVTSTCLIANAVGSVFTVCDGAGAFLASNVLRLALVAGAGLVAGALADSEANVVALLFGALALGYVVAWFFGLLTALRADRRSAA